MGMHLEEMHEYVMFQLHQTFFINNAPSHDEILLQDKVTVMQFLEPEAYGVPKKLDSTSKEMVFAWKMAIKQLQKIAEMQTPKTKLLQIGKAIEIIQNSLELYHGETVNADDVVSALPYLLVQAQIPRLEA